MSSGVLSFYLPNPINLNAYKGRDSILLKISICLAMIWPSLPELTSSTGFYRELEWDCVLLCTLEYSYLNKHPEPHKTDQADVGPDIYLAFFPRFSQRNPFHPWVRSDNSASSPRGAVPCHRQLVYIRLTSHGFQSHFSTLRLGLDMTLTLALSQLGMTFPEGL